MCGHRLRLVVVALTAACWVCVSCGYVFGEGLGTGSAKVLHVAPQEADYKNIQAAVDAAGPGVEIMVASGTYTESIWIAKAGLTLRSANKHGAKIVAPQKKDAFGLGVGANNITLDGFDITAPGGNGVQTNGTGTRHVFNHHTIVRNCYVHDCGCGGIQLNHGDYRTVEYNIVYHCVSTGSWDQSGISFWQAIALDRKPGFHIIVRGNILWNNSNPPKGTDGNGLIIVTVLPSASCQPCYLGSVGGGPTFSLRRYHHGEEGRARSEAGEILASGVAETRAEWADGEGVLPPAAALRVLPASVKNL